MSTDLPPTQYLIMDVLAARTRLGEAMWTFPTSVRPALNALRDRGFLWWKSGVGPYTCEAFLTDAGRAEALYEGYVPRCEVVEAKLAEVRELALALGDRSDEPADDRPTDRRLMEPLRRGLLAIVDRP